MHWQPASGTATARRRNELLERARRYFDRCDVLAVDTPTLSRYGVTDPNIDSLQAIGADGQARFMQTSPEFYMKRLLADGYPDIYSISKVFRDSEAGRRHSREFTMIEWYRLAFDLDAIIDDTLSLIGSCLGEPRLQQQAVVVDYRDAFLTAVDIDILSCDIAQLARAANADTGLRNAIGDDRDAWLDLLLGTRVVGSFSPERLTVLRHYPASQAALARRCPVDDRVADRFEVFYGDLELANGYVELTDAIEQENRWQSDAQKRRAAGKPVLEPDQYLLAALHHGLPECAGVALGFERLHMLADAAASIDQVLTFTSD